MAIKTTKQRLRFLLFFSLIVNLCHCHPEARCSIQNLIGEPVYISDEPRRAPSRRSTVDVSGEFTLSFWFRKSKTTSTDKINILTLYNPSTKTSSSLENKDKVYNDFPACPVSPSYIAKHPNYSNDPYIKNNPNCFPDKSKETVTGNVRPVDFVQKVLEVSFVGGEEGTLLFDFPVGFDYQSGVVSFLTQTLQKIQMKSEDWLFASITFDYPNGVGSVYVFNFGAVKNDHQINFKLNLPEFQLKRGHSLSYSENQGKEDVYGYLYDLNLFYMYMEDIKLLRLFNFDEYTSSIQNIKLELLFDSKDGENPIVARGEKGGNYLPKGTVTMEKTGLSFKNHSFIDIGVIEALPDHRIVESISIYLVFKLQNEVNENFVLLTGKREGKTLSVNLVREDKELSVFYALEFTLTGTDIRYRTPRFLEIGELCQLTFSIVKSSDKFLNFYFSSGKRLFDLSPLYSAEDLNLQKMALTLFDKDNKGGEVLVYRFVVLDNPLPSILAVQKNPLLEFCNRNCALPLDPHTVAKGCLECKDSVLLPGEDRCAEFCPVGTKNSGGTCVECRKPLCQETDPTSLRLSRLNNTAFLVELSRRINQLDATNLGKIFSIEMEGLRRKEYNYTMTIGSSKVILLNMGFSKGFYNKTLHVKTNFTSFDFVYDENRNSVLSLESYYDIPVVHYLNTKTKFWTDLCANIVFTIFLCIVGIGLVLLVVSFRYNLNEQIVKKFSILFRDMQLLPLLLFLHIAFPSNLHAFLFDLYSHLTGFNTALSPLAEDPYLVEAEVPHPNFFDKQLTSLFIQNFGVVLAVHSILLIAYFSVLLMNVFYACLSMKMKEFVIRARDAFEFNLLIVAFVVFDFQIFFFANLNFQNPVLTSDLGKASLYVAIGYIAIIGLFSLAFVLSYFSNNAFVPQSDKKFKLSFMFIGYRNKQLPNIFELVVLLFHFGVCCVLVYLRTTPLRQITACLFLMVLFLGVQLLINPYEENREEKLESVNRVTVIGIFALVAVLAVDDLNGDFQNDFREAVGWAIIFLIVAYVLVNFIIAVVQLTHFIIRIKKSSKLIFYDKEEEISGFQQKRNYSIRQGKGIRKEVDIEEKGNKRVSLGKLGDLGTGMDQSFFITEKRGNRGERVELRDEMDSRMRNRDSYISHSDDSYQSDMSRVKNKFKEMR